jgi:hypothetical protein
MDIENQEPIFDDSVSKLITEFPDYDDKKKIMMSLSGIEIVADLTISVLIKNPEDSAAFPETRNMYNNNYWIPVPSGHNVDEYVLAFLTNFEKAMSSSIE